MTVLKALLDGAPPLAVRDGRGGAACRLTFGPKRRRPRPRQVPTPRLKPRRRDEASETSKSSTQILVPGSWIVLMHIFQPIPTAFQPATKTLATHPPYTPCALEAVARTWKCADSNRKVACEKTE